MFSSATHDQQVPRARHWAAQPRTGGLLVLAALIALLPLVLGNAYFYDVAILVALNATVCIGLNLLIGYAGQISLGHAAFFALGGYASTILATRYGWPVGLCVPAACASVALLAFVIGRPTLRLKGHTLAMATLGLGVIVAIALNTEDRLTGGPDGMAVPPLVLFGWVVQGERVWYWVAGGVLLLTAWLVLNLIDSPNGRALRALHGSEIAAQTLGISSAHYKLQAFVLSALFAALAGALAAHYAGFISPAKASFTHSVELVIMVVFGGMASVFGAIVGAAVLTTLPHLLTVLKDYEMMVFGAVLIATMVLFPHGVVPTLGRWWASRRDARSRP
ncbi:MAG: branched-chain amino acid ABC transporter permease [Burkholderiales bacterium]|nr:branched-chain amino acid ABC transporter permease [Burkholderiales bacterium]